MLRPVKTTAQTRTAFMKAIALIFLFIFVTKDPVFAQAVKPVYKNLVMEGGGMRGIAYGGALNELQKQGILPQIERVGGTSAGAIQAMLLAVGYTPDEITRITYETNLKAFADGKFIFFGGFTRIAKQFGRYRGEKFSKWLGKLIAQKTGNADITFSQLHALAGKNHFRDLYVTGTNLSKQQAEVLSYETYPEMKVRDAVRISMSIPLYFRAVAIDSVGKTLSLKQNPKAANIMVDGGIVANFPIQIFDFERYLNAQKSPKSGKPVFNPETIGLRLDRTEQIAYDQQLNGLAPFPIHNFNDYMAAFYNIVIENLNRNTLKPEDWPRTVSINTLQFQPEMKLKKLSAEQKEQLLQSGRQAVQDFLARKP